MSEYLAANDENYHINYVTDKAANDEKYYFSLAEACSPENNAHVAKMLEEFLERYNKYIILILYKKIKVTD